eukprot:1159992-Rhodomonas_salina.1
MRIFFEQVKTSVCNQMLSWLRNQSKKASAERVLSLSVPFDNVPANFMYWALGRKFFSTRPHQSAYNPV